MSGWAAVLLGLSLSVVARADTSYPGTSGSGDGFPGTGKLYAVNNGTPDGSYTIVGIDGTGVTGLIAVDGFNSNDNLLYPGQSPSLDEGGFAFTDTMGDTGYQVRLFGNTDGSYGVYIIDSDGDTIDGPATFTLGSPVDEDAAVRRAFSRANLADSPKIQEFSFVFAAAPAASATPEPASFALMGTGLLAAAGLVRRRARK